MDEVLWLCFWTLEIFAVVISDMGKFFCGHDFGCEKIFGSDFGHGNFLVVCNDGSNFVLQKLNSRGSLQMLKGIWEILSPNIKNIINEAGFQTFFQALLNQETHEYKDL